MNLRDELVKHSIRAEAARLDALVEKRIREIVREELGALIGEDGVRAVAGQAMDAQRARILAEARKASIIAIAREAADARCQADPLGTMSLPTDRMTSVTCPVMASAISSKSGDDGSIHCPKNRAAFDWVTGLRAKMQQSTALFAKATAATSSAFVKVMSVISSVLVATRRRWNESRRSGK